MCPGGCALRGVVAEAPARELRRQSARGGQPGGRGQRGGYSEDGGERSAIRRTLRGERGEGSECGCAFCKPTQELASDAIEPGDAKFAPDAGACSFYSRACREHDAAGHRECDARPGSSASSIRSCSDHPSGYGSSGRTSGGFLNRCSPQRLVPPRSARMAELRARRTFLKPRRVLRTQHRRQATFPGRRGRRYFCTGARLDLRRDRMGRNSRWGIPRRPSLPRPRPMRPRAPERLL